MDLTKAELERLALLSKECTEVIHMVNKIILHGYESCHPEFKATKNRELLEDELGDLSIAVNLCGQENDINRFRISSLVNSPQNKDRKNQYLKYNVIK